MTNLFKKVGVWIQIWYGKMSWKFVSQTPQIPFQVWPTTLSPPPNDTSSPVLSYQHSNTYLIPRIAGIHNENPWPKLNLIKTLKKNRDAQKLYLIVTLNDSKGYTLKSYPKLTYDKSDKT